MQSGSTVFEVSSIGAPDKHNAPEPEKAKDEEDLSILLKRQKQKYSVLLERAHAEIKKQRGESEKSRIEIELLKEVLLVGCGIQFQAKDLKEAIQTFMKTKQQKEQNRLDGATDINPNLKKLPPITTTKEADDLSPIPPDTPHRPVPSRKAVSLKKGSVIRGSLNKDTQNEQQQQQQQEAEADDEKVAKRERFRIVSALLGRNIYGKKGKPKKKGEEPPLLPKPPTPPIRAKVGTEKLGETGVAKRIKGVRQLRKNQAKEIVEQNIQ